VIQRGGVADQAVYGEAGEAAAQEGRYLGLINTEQPGGGGLGERSLTDNVTDLPGQVSFDKGLGGLGDAEVGEDISGTGGDWDLIVPRVWNGERGRLGNHGRDLSGAVVLVRLQKVGRC